MSRYRVTNDRSPNGGDQEFSDRKTAERYARTLNDRHSDAHATVVPVRESHRARSHVRHLYTHGAEPREIREFEERYGKEKGDYVYGAVVGKVKRERAAKRSG